MGAIATISLLPFLLSNSNDLQVTEGYLYLLEDFPDDSDGISVPLSVWDGPVNLRPDSHCGPGLQLRLGRKYSSSLTTRRMGAKRPQINRYGRLASESWELVP